MTKSIYKTMAILLVFTMVISSGCEKIIDINPPLERVSTDLVFASDKLATSARSGMFSSLSQTNTQSQGLTIYSSLQADDLLYLSNVVNIQEFNNNTYSELSTTPGVIFSDWYAVIYRANAIIEGLATSTGTSEAIRKLYTAEAKFVRAYCYFNLVNSFGDVPLVLITDPNITAFLPRETAANVYTQILADLTAAKADLGLDYASTSADRVGVNKFVATALLARVYLFTANYAAAETNASEVIAATNLYSLIPKANIGTALFSKNSTECIWQMSPPIAAANRYTNEGTAFIPSSTTSAINFAYRLDLRFTALFEAKDDRSTKWMARYTFAGDTYTIPYKYKYPSQATALAANVTENQLVMRLAEQYLIRAEARARIGTNLAGSLADLKVIQARAGATESTASTSVALLTDIALENRKEFFCEQAFRWFNLKRTGQADAVIGAIKASYRPYAQLLPFPQTILDVNYNLIQTPGYVKK